MMMMGHMKPVFQWVTDVQVLFQDWTTATAIELALAMLVAAFLAAAYQWLIHWLSVWDGPRGSLSDIPRWKRTCVRFSRSLTHALIAAVSYVEMLFAMTYDLRIFIAIILGSGVGYFLGFYYRKTHLARKSDKNRACAESDRGSLNREHEAEAGRLVQGGENGLHDGWGVEVEGQSGGENGDGSNLLGPSDEVDRETSI